MIYVITHKKFDTSILDNNIYRVLYVGTGKDCESSYLRDNIGDNISAKNPFFCELTGLYWVWKNEKVNPNEITGLVHYRRYFTTQREYDDYKRNGIMPTVLRYEVISCECDSNSIILPKRYYTINNLYNSYRRCHDIEDIAIIKSCIKDVCPKYLPTFEKIMKQHYGYYFNMMICRKEILDDYCEWLFNLFDNIERHIDLSKYENNYQKRVFGFMAERLLQVWVIHNKLKIIEYPVFNAQERPISNMQRNLNRVNCIKEKIIKKKH